jgi:hypothetical protein
MAAEALPHFPATTAPHGVAGGDGLVESERGR